MTTTAANGEREDGGLEVEPNAAPSAIVEAPQVAAGENPLERATDISQGREYAGVGHKTKAPARANPQEPTAAAPYTFQDFMGRVLEPIKEKVT